MKLFMMVMMMDKTMEDEDEDEDADGCQSDVETRLLVRTWRVHFGELSMFHQMDNVRCLTCQRKI